MSENVTRPTPPTAPSPAPRTPMYLLVPRGLLVDGVPQLAHDGRGGVDTVCLELTADPHDGSVRLTLVQGR